MTAHGFTAGPTHEDVERAVGRHVFRLIDREYEMIDAMRHEDPKRIADNTRLCQLRQIVAEAKVTMLDESVAAATGSRG